MSDLLKSIDARTRLAGTNKLEMLLFSLGTDQRTQRSELFGINVFKVREVMRTPPITAAPDMPPSVKGMVSLRGVLVPVVDLAEYIGIVPQKPRDIMIVTEYNGHTQGFLVESVDTILRVDWSEMKIPPEMLTTHLGGLVTAVTELADKRLVMMLDVERLLSETTHYDDAHMFTAIESAGKEGFTILFADDSSVARGQIRRTLDAMGLKYIETVNGRKALEELDKIALSAEQSGKKVRDLLQLILTDVEMPEMDGYMLTKSIKSDPRFAGIPIVMHSSLSSQSNQKLGASVGVDEYVHKFQPQLLADTLIHAIRRGISGEVSGQQRRAA
jgi:two-component system chemotaxis response regulator CheV